MNWDTWVRQIDCLYRGRPRQRHMGREELAVWVGLLALLPLGLLLLVRAAYASKWASGRHGSLARQAAQPTSLQARFCHKSGHYAAR